MSLTNMKSYFSGLLFVSMLAFLTQCDSDSEDNDMPVPVPVQTIFDGTFTGPAIQGLDFSSSATSGITDVNGTFQFEKGKTISFSVGDISIGEISGKASINLLELLNTHINDQEFRNVASFLLSLDNDQDPSNGINISDQTKQALSNESLDFDSDNFLFELKELITRVKAKNSSSLTVVLSNDAALHMAKQLNVEEEFAFLPRLFQGREWEEGEYWDYNGLGHEEADEYYWKIGSDLKGVRLNFGDDYGFYMDMVYEQNKLIGYGNTYVDLNAATPVNTLGYDYRNRIGSPGFVFDYRNDTMLGAYNFFKTEGEAGKLAGSYEAFLEFDEKRTGYDPETRQVMRREVFISEVNADGDYPFQFIQYRADGDIDYELSGVIAQEEVNNENIVLVRFQSTDYIFVNRDIEETESYFFPGRFSIKK